MQLNGDLNPGLSRLSPMLASSGGGGVVVCRGLYSSLLLQVLAVIFCGLGPRPLRILPTHQGHGETLLSPPLPHEGQLAHETAGSPCLWDLP